MFDKEQNFAKLMEKYALDMSAMCNLMAHVLELVFKKEVQEMNQKDAKEKVLCLIHKAFLETIDIGIQTKNGNYQASRGLTNIINNMARQIGVIDKECRVEFEHKDIDGQSTFQSKMSILKREKKSSADSVDIDSMIKNAGLKKGGAEA